MGGSFSREKYPEWMVRHPWKAKLTYLLPAKIIGTVAGSVVAAAMFVPTPLGVTLWVHKLKGKEQEAPSGAESKKGDAARDRVQKKREDVKSAQELVNDTEKLKNDPIVDREKTDLEKARKNTNAMLQRVRKMQK